jgi:hypothetical protein
MKRVRLWLAWLFVAAFATAAHAVSTVDFSDQWWVPAESGWGAAVLQQSNTLVVNLMVYGTDGKPTWFFASAPLQRKDSLHTVFAGDLYATTGPYYGAGFNPAMVTLRKVGTLTFDADGAVSATITYSVDGTPVVKHVTRQPWGVDDWVGTYRGGWNADRSGCIQGPGNETHFDEALTIVVSRNADGTLTVTLQYADGGTDSFTGVYVQSGRLGRMDVFMPQNPGNVTFSEIAITTAGFTARFAGDLVSSRWRDWCDMTNGRIGGVLR